MPPPVDAIATYDSGSVPVMVSWSKFQHQGKDPECFKSIKVSLEIYSVWHDQRFASEKDWLQYTPKTISNENDQSYFILNSDPI